MSLCDKLREFRYMSQGYQNKPVQLDLFHTAKPACMHIADISY